MNPYTIRITAPTLGGYHTSTKVVIIHPDGTEMDVTNCIQKVVIELGVGQVSKAQIQMICAIEADVAADTEIDGTNVQVTTP